MKTLTILRHAKSNWSSTDVSDHGRELSSRGLRDAMSIALSMQEAGICPDIILCSTATRAQQTIAAFAKDGCAQETILTKHLYLAYPTAICDEIASVSDKYTHILICGHNPGLTDFVNERTYLSIGDLPTGGIVSAQFAMESWSDIYSNRGNVSHHILLK